MRRTAILLLLLFTAACGGSARLAPTATPSSVAAAPTAVPSAAPRAGPLTKLTPHVFVVVMENKSYAEAMAQPFTAGLAARGAVATDYHAISHPSLPNYLALTAGSTFGIRDDGYHVLPDGGIGRQLTDAGVPWRAYMEGMGADCRAGNNLYAIKHDPFAYYGAACPSNVVPMDQLYADLAAGAPSAPRFSWITPNMCHDGHDCSASVADNFLSELVGQITGSPAFRDHGVLFLVWDEDDGGSGNRVPLIVVGPTARVGISDLPHDHYSLLATVEDLLSVSRLGEAANTAALSDLVAVPAIR